MAYTGFVIEVKNIRSHDNADNLQIVDLFNTSVVVGLDVKEGDKMVYFPTDGQLSYELALQAGLLRENLKGEKLSGYMDPKKCNVRAIRLRGEHSDGILLPVHILNDFTKTESVVGDKIDVVNGTFVCKKYVPRSATPKNSIPSKTVHSKKRELEEKYPLFQEHKDTQQFAYFYSKFKEGDVVTMTLKVHGTSQRTTNTLVTNLKKTLLDKILFRESKREWKVISGTRRVILEDYEGGYYGTNNFRKKWNDFFTGKLLKGETVYYELVGYDDNGKSIMPKCNNRLMNDKDFAKKWGEETLFNYGLNVGENEIYVYRMTMTNEDGDVVEYSTDQIALRCEQMGVKMTPVLERFIVTSEEDLLARVKKHTSGADPIGMTHIREGVVLRIENNPEFEAYKNKSFEFKVLEGIIKEHSSEADMEELESEVV